METDCSVSELAVLSDSSFDKTPGTTAEETAASEAATALDGAVLLVL